MIITSIILLLLLITVACVWYAYQQSVYITGKKVKKHPITIFPDQFKVPFENVIFKNKEGINLKGWFIPAAQPSEKTIIFMHGWGMNKGGVLPYTVFLRNEGFNLFYFDFRGYGDSQEGVTSVGYLEIKDADAAIEILKATRPQESKEIAIYGISMGAAVAIYEAAHNESIKAVVAEGCYYSYDKVVFRWAKMHRSLPNFPLVPLALFFVRRRLGLDPEAFSPRHNIAKIKGKAIFIINGSDDALAPRHDARKLFRKASEPKHLWIVANAQHTASAEVAGQQYKNRISEFYKKYL